MKIQNSAKRILWRISRDNCDLYDVRIDLRIIARTNFKAETERAFSNAA